jgi:tetratricopeptide (TPR) repeat protein
VVNKRLKIKINKVNSLKENSERIFKELLSSFFTAKEISEIRNLLESSSLNLNPNLKINAKDRKQIDTEFPGERIFVAQIDQIILYAKEKLQRNNFLPFLMSVGEYALNEGQTDLSLEIYEMVIRDSKGNPENTENFAEAKLQIADVYKKKNKWVLSLKFLEESKEIYQKLGNDNGKARCANMLGTIYGEIGNIRKAKLCFEESLDLISSVDDHELIGIIQINLGIINGIFADFKKSKEYFNKALKYFGKKEDKKRIAEIHNNLAMMEYSAGNFGISLDEYNKCIEQSLKLNYFQILGLAFLGKAITYLKLNSLELAAVFSEKAMTVCNKSADRLTAADIYKVKGIIERENGRYREAENLLKTSLMMNIELGNKLNEAETSLELGILFNLNSEKRKSTEMLRNALTYYKSQGYDEKVKEILGYL